MSKAAELAALLSGVTITTADNTSQLTLTSTDADATAGPRLDLKRDSGSPADSDTLGRIRFYLIMTQRSKQKAFELMRY